MEKYNRLDGPVMNKVNWPISDDEVIPLAVEKFTLQMEILKAIEELSELTTELSRWLQDDGRTDPEKIAEETADVMIMCEQVALMYGYDEVMKWKEFKLKRLKERLEERMR